MQLSLHSAKRSKRHTFPVRRRLGVVGVLTLALAFVVGLPRSPQRLWSRSPNPETATASIETTEEAARALEAKIQVLSSNAPGAAANLHSIVITEFEANSYLKVRGRDFLPPGVYEPEVHVHPDRLTGAADVDFNELARAGPKADEWTAKILTMIFSGKQRVSATGKLDTANGQGKVTIENVTVGTATMPDWLVNLLLENYVQKRYNIDLSKPLILPDHVTHIDLSPGLATVFRNPNKK